MVGYRYCMNVHGSLLEALVIAAVPPLPAVRHSICNGLLSLVAEWFRDLDNHTKLAPQASMSLVLFAAACGSNSLSSK